ncbi:hypothetical protein BCR36DRAFT_588056 [Piromyces finnis]|uniref:Uncharacterized protein n=1 Tax=Piromyces finnis TaxID=1754191 RepID=A0A1Y1UTZ0_9FUNG|nr:hypothetical protein BCR36DRAFT_588056 [Piromyces finnis]|eukprot:ORX41422.1 hypothetical protein BCR36DRAFT_588056 [Piromyces finnis]
MRIINLFIILIVSVSSYANSVKFLRRDVTANNEELLKINLSEECRMEYENSEYIKCSPSITLTNYKDTCSDFKSEKCQNFYKDPLKYYPICKDSPIFAEIYQPTMIKTILQTYDTLCQTDENGELCPFSLHLMTNNSGGADVLNAQCKSKKCTESLIKVYKDVSIDQYATLESSSQTTGSFTYEDISAKNELISMLESNECQSLHSTSDTTTVKTNTTLLVLLSLLLLLFFH